MQREDREQPVVKLLRLIVCAIAAGLLAGFIALPAVGSAGLAARDGADSFQSLSTTESLDLQPPERTRALDKDRKEFAQFYDFNREHRDLSKIAPIMQKAIIAIEDSRFYEHGPLDPKGTMRALLTNAGSGETQQGGSTLTQQYVKNLLVLNATSEEDQAAAQAPNLGRKIRELRYAVYIEKKMSKNQILEGYLNVAYFGNLAYGVEAAARRYFDKPASKLTLGEAALLAGVTKSPQYYDPVRNSKAAIQRRNIVLNRMAELKMITQQQADEVKNTPVKLNQKPARAGCFESKAPYFCKYVEQEILSNPMFGKTEGDRKRLLYQGGLTIQTTLDLRAQRAADLALRRLAPAASRRTGIEAMVEPGTGYVKALSSNRKFGLKKKRQQTQINLPANQRHGGSGYGFSPGSAFKVFTLAAAIEEGIEVGRSIKGGASTVVTGYTDCKGRGLSPFPVKNAERAEKGAYTLKTGTWHSVNTFYALLEKEVGVCKAVKMAEKFGVRQSDGKDLKELPSQVLGTNGIDMVSLAAAYAGFANRGEFCTPIAITEIRARGKQVKIPRKDCKRVLDADIADKMNDILRGVFTQGTAKRYGGLGARPAAGKTGTAESNTSITFAGYTPNLSAAVWFGNPDAPYKDPMTGRFGADLVPTWRASMNGALLGQPIRHFHRPGDDFGDTPPVEVPEVTGMKPRKAARLLREAGFTVAIGGRVKSPEPKGRVARTNPKAGDTTEHGTNVTIFVSNGKGGGFPPNFPGDPHDSPQPPGWQPPVWPPREN